MNLQRILTTDKIIDNNNIQIFLPDEIDLETDDYFELIIYKLDGIFSYKQEQVTNTAPSSIIIDNTLSATCIDSILRDGNGNRILFSNILKTDENENTIEFVNYNNNINDIIIYTNEFTESYHVTQNDTDNIHWETDNRVYISHSLSGDVNIILRNIKDNSMFKYI